MSPSRQSHILIVLMLVTVTPVIAGDDCPIGPFKCFSMPPPKHESASVDPKQKPIPKLDTKPPLPKPRKPPGSIWVPAKPGIIEADPSITDKSTASLIKELKLPRLTDDDVPEVQSILGDRINELNKNKYYYAPSNNRGVIFQGKDIQK